MNKIVKQRGYAYVGGCGTAANGGNNTVLCAVAKAGEYLLAAQLAFLKVLLHQRFVSLRRGLGKGLVYALGLAFEIGGDGYLLFALAVKLPGDHVRHVYIAYELAAFHYGKLHGNYARPELFIYFSHNLCEVRIFAIHLVDDYHARLVVLFTHCHRLFRTDDGA